MSVIELARLSSRPDEGNTMEARMRAAVDELQRAEGAIRVEAYRGVEAPDSFVFVIEWQTVEAHLAYRETPGFATYRSHIADLVDGKPEFAHYRLVAEGER